MVSKVHLVIQVEMELRDERAFQVPKELTVDQEYPV
jgi:hypothetical protein